MTTNRSNFAISSLPGSLLMLLLSLCAPGGAQENRKVRMAYSAFSISFLNVFIARDAGLFKKHGLEVELIQMAGPLPVAALAAGEIDYLTGYTTGIVATGQGAPLKGIMIALRKPPFYLVGEPGDPKARRFARQAHRRRPHRQPATSGHPIAAESERNRSGKSHLYSNRFGVEYGDQPRSRRGLGRRAIRAA